MTAWRKFGRGQTNGTISGTGLVFYAAQSPLSILNARFNRSRGLYAKNLDIAVKTVVGALEVDIGSYIADVERQKINNDDDKLSILQNGMLVEMVQMYQWRLLLFATVKRTPASNMSGIWIKVIEIAAQPGDQPLVVSLEHFLATKNLEDRFSPPSITPKNPPVPPKSLDKSQFELPMLRYEPTPNWIVVGQKPGFKLFDPAAYKADFPLWRKCMFYDKDDSVPGRGVFLPNFKVVDFSDWKTVWGDNTVLIPLENLSVGLEPWEKKVRLRCVVASYFGKNLAGVQYPAAAAGKQVALFRGIADLEGSSSSITNPPQAGTGSIELTEDLMLY